MEQGASTHLMGRDRPKMLRVSSPSLGADALYQWFLNPRVGQNHLETSLKHKLLGLPSVFNSLGLGWGLKICISNKLPGGENVAGLGCCLRTIILLKATLLNQVRRPSACSCGNQFLSIIIPSSCSVHSFNLCLPH